MSKILLVDDDVELSELLSEILTLEGFEIDAAYNGQEALDKLDSSYSIILLDIMMPVLNGIDTLKRIREQYSIPVLMLTARGDDIDRVQGLELGADDYLPKPFNDRELIARIKAILRRTSNNSVEQENNSNSNSNAKDKKQIEFQGIALNVQLQQASYEGTNLDLTGSEFALLYILVKNAGQVLSREVLSINALGKALLPFDRTVDMHMSNLRKKLPVRENALPWFKTLRGRGYILLTD